LDALRARGLYGVEFVVSGDHPGLKKAITEVLSGVFWQRCYVHFLRNALDHVPLARSTTIVCLSFDGCTTGAI
jgi:transposase-like protein